MDHEHSSRSELAGADRLGRLAELVVHLTDCDAEAALDSVIRVSSTAPATVDDALAIVAGAICGLQNRIDLRDSRADLRVAYAAGSGGR